MYEFQFMDLKEVIRFFFTYKKDHQYADVDINESTLDSFDLFDGRKDCNGGQYIIKN